MVTGAIGWAERNQLVMIKEETTPGTENNQCKGLKCDEPEVFQGTNRKTSNGWGMGREQYSGRKGQRGRQGPSHVVLSIKTKSLGFDL